MRSRSIRSLISASAVMAGVTAVVVGAIFLSSLYMQRVIGLSAVQTGLAFLPLAAAITGTAAVASKLLGRVSPRTMIAFGLVIMGAGALLLASNGGEQQYLADVLPGFLVLGAGVGPMVVAISVAAISDVPPTEPGSPMLADSMGDQRRARPRGMSWFGLARVLDAGEARPERA